MIEPSDFVGRTFILDKEDGKCLRTCIVKALGDFEGDLARDSSPLKCVCSMNDDTIEDACAYNELLDHVNNSKKDDLVELKFKAMIAHEGLLPRSNANHNGSPFNLRT